MRTCAPLLALVLLLSLAIPSVHGEQKINSARLRDSPRLSPPLAELAYWSNLDHVQDGLVSVLTPFFDSIFSNLQPLQYPLIDRLPYYLFLPARSITSGSRISALRTTWARTLHAMHSSAHVEEDLAAILPDTFMTVFCGVFGDFLSACPAGVPSPQLGSTARVWQVTFTRQDPLPLTSLNLNLGAYGTGPLEWSTPVPLTIATSLSFTLAYSANVGLTLTLDSATPSYTAVATLAPSGGSTLAGNLLGIGFDFTPTGQLTATLSVTSARSITLDILGQMSGAATLGMAGPLASQLQQDASALRPLPHLESTLSMSWEWHMSAQVALPKTFAFTSPVLCIDTYLLDLARTFVRAVEMVLTPYDVVLGPTGLFLADLPVSEPLAGHNAPLAVVLRFAFTKCDSGVACSIAGLFEAIATYSDTAALLAALTAAAAVNPSGSCGITQPVQNFALDFSAASLAPQWSGPSPSRDLNFVNPNLAPYRLDLTTRYKQMTTAGFAFHLGILDDPVDKIIQVMLGQNSDIATFQLPNIAVSIPGASWNSKVLTTPIVVLLPVHMTASFVLQQGLITLSSAGIVSGVMSANSGHTLSGVSMPVGGLTAWSAALTATGYEEIASGDYRGETEVNFQITGAGSFVSINGNPVVSFDELATVIAVNNGNPASTVDLTVQGAASYEMHLDVCDDPYDRSKCNHVRQDSPQWAVANYVWSSATIAPIAAATGAVQLASVSAGALPTVELYPNSASTLRVTAFTTNVAATSPPLARSTPHSPVSFDGNSGAPFAIYLRGGITDAVTTPTGAFTLRVDSASYGPAFAHRVGPSSVAPSTSVQSCTSLTYDELMEGSSITFTDGVPCATTVSSVSTASAFVTGTPAAFAGKPITIAGSLGELHFSVLSSTISVGSALVSAAPDVRVNIPAPVTRIYVTGIPSASNAFALAGSVSGSEVYVTGGEGSDDFALTLSDHLGAVFIDGAEFGSDTNQLSITVDGSQGSVATLTAGSAMQDNENTGNHYVINHRNVPRRVVNLLPTANQQMRLTILGVESDGFVEVYTTGAVGAVITHELLSCDNQSEVRIYCSGPGQHLIIIGDGSSTMQNFGRCTVRILGSLDPDQDIRLFLMQGNEIEALQHTFDLGYYAVRDPFGPWLFTVTFKGLNWIVLNAGYVSAVDFLAGTPGMEVVIAFPPNAPDQQNSAVIESWTDAVLVNGSFSNLTIGKQADPRYSIDPFYGADSLLAVKADLPDSLLYLVSGQDQPGITAPPQSFIIDGYCLNPLDITHSIPALATPPSEEMLSMLQQDGFDSTHDYSSCHVAYVGQVHFVIETGGGVDWFNASSPSAPLNISLGDQDDILLWSLSTNGSVLHADLGLGRDKVALGMPLGADVTVALGDEQQVDSVDLYTGILPPPSFGSDSAHSTAQLSPIGLQGETLVVSQYGARSDVIHTRRGAVGTPITWAQAVVQDGSVVINASSAGEVLKVDLQDGLSFILVACGADTTVVLDPIGSDPSSPPIDSFSVTIRLPDYSANCFVSIPSVTSTESTVTVELTGAAGPAYSALIQEMAFPGFVTTSFGGFRIQTSYVTHLSISSTVQLSPLLIDGTAGADLFVSAPVGSSAVSGMARFAGHALFVGVDFTIPSFVLQSGVLVISTGGARLGVNATFVDQTLFTTGEIAFWPPQPLPTLFSPWFVQQAQLNGVGAALTGQMNAYAWQDSSVMLYSPQAEVSGVGSSLTRGALLSVIAGNLVLHEDAPVMRANLSNIQLTVATESTTDYLYTAAISSGFNSSVYCSFDSVATLAVGYATVVSPAVTLWTFEGTLQSQLRWSTPSCVGVLQGQVPLPDVTITQLNSELSLNASLIPDLEAFDLAVAVIGDSSKLSSAITTFGSAGFWNLRVSLSASNASVHYVIMMPANALNTTLHNHQGELAVEMGVYCDASLAEPLVTISGNVHSTSELMVDVEGNSNSLDLAISADGAANSSATLTAQDGDRAVLLAVDANAFQVQMSVLGSAAANDSTPLFAAISGQVPSLQLFRMTQSGNTAGLVVDLSLQLGEIVASLSPKLATARSFTVLPSAITASSDGLDFLRLDIANVLKQSMQLLLVDAANTAVLNSSLITPVITVHQPASLLLTGDGASTLAVRDATLHPVWQRSVFRPTPRIGASDCLRPVPDCSPEVWIETSAEGALCRADYSCNRTRAAAILISKEDIQCPANGVYSTSSFTVAINSTVAPIIPPYRLWTKYFAIALVIIAWLVGVAIWTAFGFFSAALWAELVITAAMAHANAHTSPLFLSLIRSLQHVALDSLAISCGDASRVDTFAWVGIAVALVVAALLLLEAAQPAAVQRFVPRIILVQRFFSAVLIFYLAPIASAHFVGASASVIVRFAIMLCVMAFHVGVRLFFRLRGTPAGRPLLLGAIPAGLVAALLTVGVLSRVTQAGAALALGLLSALILSALWAVRGWLWHKRDALLWGGVAYLLAALLALVCAIAFFASLYSARSSAALFALGMLWWIFDVAAALIALVAAIATKRKGGDPVAAARDRDSMTSPLLL